MHCLGKNGEPRPFTPIQVTLTSSRLGSKTTDLVADRLGKIYLGKCPHVLSINCRSTHDNVSRTWNIFESKSDSWSYPGEMHIIEDGQSRFL